MTDEQIRIERNELFDPEVDKALARERVGRERIVADTPTASPIRRLLLNSMFYLPLAAVLGAFITWWLLEPHINDHPVIGGEIALVNAEPFDMPAGIIQLTVGSQEVLIDPTRLELAPGVNGEPAFASADELKVGVRIEAAGIPEGHRLAASVIRPTVRAEPHGSLEEPRWPLYLLFPLTAALIAFGLLLAEGITTRNWVRMIVRTLLGSFLATVFAVLAFFPAGLILLISQAVLHSEVGKHPDLVVVTVKNFGLVAFLVQVACRSAAWACIGAACGLGMNLVWSTRTQLRNSVVGGALGGAFGGLFFDPISRFFESSAFAGGAASRCVGLIAVGLSIGVFVALVERMGRDAWLRVRTGPLAGKSFILYKTPSIIGNAPQSDVYLYKDAEIDPSHAAIHRVGTVYEIEDLDTRMGTSVGGNKIRRRRLASGDQIVIGSTILDFEERQKRTPAA
ncbi:MAG TPA: FHA domain-containing protein [Kofleriaceae bacterium]